jgi:hypothetical protein
MQKLTLTRFEVDGDYTAQDFDCDFTVWTAGDGLWGCEADRQVRVTGISIVTNAYDDNVSVMVNVTHNSTWDIYTDSAFASAISDALGVGVRFTEQGMQEDEIASMEV